MVEKVQRVTVSVSDADWVTIRPRRLEFATQHRRMALLLNVEEGGAAAKNNILY